MTLESDLDLVTRCRQGDEGAFEAIYERYAGMVFNLALRMSGDPEEAADLSQETFLKIHRHLAGFKGRASLRTWIYRVTLNCCRSRYRRQRLWRSRRMDARERRLEQLPDRRRGPEERAIADDASRRLLVALEQVPEVYREAVVLRDIEGLSYREISRVLRLRLGTVRSRIARGRDHLRSLLEETP